MAKYSILKSFYASEVWQNFRLVVIGERGLRCEHCGKYVLKSSELTLHHIIELTPENVGDANIALNPDNIMVVHHECHNQIHGRFGYQFEQGVYIVYGPPLAGHDEYVSAHMSRGDIVVDMDKLFAAVSLLPSYDKPNGLLSNVRAVHNILIDNIKTRYGKWRSAWVIGGYAEKRKRERLAEDLGAELIFCDVSREECYNRLSVDEQRKHRQDEWRGYIDKWFEQYQP
ncbi:HNH endonuclease signature motif containing protein [Paenibacillus taichungensis]|uniref:HNH endonuclease signature motif containing protein n=1 Tax=Paenibacillus taichungensis TaxID=484184 RepID=UPI002DBEDED7|nr:HNH endonuclease signature motif containing protein [Paenibacillus taichungensis]MEC0107256.1 HNH endonuclease signature motif containing protein [Paenibacillus taichungensis]MEC0194812.1 HNH endonuclease signature motif containing protein [Paenibacillus taichungensis]